MVTLYTAKLYTIETAFFIPRSLFQCYLQTLLYRLISTSCLTQPQPFCLYNKAQCDLCEVGPEPVRVTYTILVFKVLITPGYLRSAAHFNAFRSCFIPRCIDRYLRLNL